MAKVFTITEGLENLGAMKTGGQGSVYKGRRIGEIITAIKLLPTPVYSESADDKNYTDFQNEVQKLKKVNEEPNPHVVRILSSGITDSGNFPFIEMEYIEGPDLEELLKPPHNPVYTIREIIKVALQLSDALAHCHKLNVKHGDIKSNNVKFNTRTGNYILLDFGLSVMSDEQRRSSLRQAGAIEFMAPEQNEGQLLFESDVYSFGVILFELVAGIVPFPLTDKGETTRNMVRLAHMATPPPDVLLLRQNNLPEAWSAEKKEREIQVPEWIVNLIYKCLDKKPERRFKNGMLLHEYVILNSSLGSNNSPGRSDLPVNPNQQLEKLVREKNQLEQQLLQVRGQLDAKDSEIKELKSIIAYKQGENEQLKENAGSIDTNSPRRGVSKAAFFSLLFLTMALGAFAVYSFLNSYQTTEPEYAELLNDSTIPSSKTEKRRRDYTRPTESETELPDTGYVEELKPVDTAGGTSAAIDSAKQQEKSIDKSGEGPVESASTVKYKVSSKAFFHDRPDDAARREAYLVSWNNAVLTAVKEQNGFIYVVYTNPVGQTSKGWLKKEDLKRVED